MAELIAAIASLIGAAGQVFLSLFESVFLGASQLASRPKVGERRFSTKRLSEALLPLSFIVLSVVGVIVFVIWRFNVAEERKRDSREIVDKCVDRLATQVDEKGHFIRHSGNMLDAKDAWGRQLSVEYEQTRLYQRIHIRSDGPDGNANTSDDIIASRQIMRPKGEIANELMRDAVNALGNRVSDDESN